MPDISAIVMGLTVAIPLALAMTLQTILTSIITSKTNKIMKQVATGEVIEEGGLLSKLNPLKKKEAGPTLTASQLSQLSIEEINSMVSAKVVSPSLAEDAIISIITSRAAPPAEDDQAAVA